MRFMVNLPFQAKSTMNLMKRMETEEGFLGLIQRFMVT